MARDTNTALFKVAISVLLTPVNRYGDELSGPGEIHFTKNLEVKNLVELGVYLERLNEKPFQYIQMVDPPEPEERSDPIF
jgi:hypothetical protein